MAFIPQAAVVALYQKQVCLVSSRRSGRWVLPKGHIKPRQTASASALAEAWEEAGLTGTLSTEAVARYHYKKSGWNYRVWVYAMEVDAIADSWPEVHQRQRLFLDPSEALLLIEQPELQQVFASLFSLHAA